MTVTKEQLFKIVDDFAKQVPIVGGKVKKFLHDAIESDSLDHDGVSDIIQILTIAESTVTTLGKITDSFDIPKVKAEVEAFQHEAIKDKALLIEGIHELETLAASVKKLTGK